MYKKEDEYRILKQTYEVVKSMEGTTVYRQVFTLYKFSRVFLIRELRKLGISRYESRES